MDAYRAGIADHRDFRKHSIEGGPTKNTFDELEPVKIEFVRSADSWKITHQPSDLGEEDETSYVEQQG